MNYWLVKSEPFKYSWDQFVSEGETFWNGVRNYQARNNMKAMAKGDKVLFYHSNEGLEVVGVAIVSKEHYQDPTTDDPNWVVVDLKPVEKLKHPVTLAEMKKMPAFADLSLIKQSRLSVCPVKKEEFELIMEMSKEARV